MALSNEQLALLDETREVLIETGGRVKTIIWIVVVDNDVYVRSVRGPEGAWYRRALTEPRVSILVDDHRMDFDGFHVTDEEVIDAVSDALRNKYPPGESLDRMTRDEVLDTTLRLDPVS